jgi:hypothetical protein
LSYIERELKIKISVSNLTELVAFAVREANGQLMFHSIVESFSNGSFLGVPGAFKGAFEKQRCLGLPPMIEELKKAIARSNRDKAPGETGIPAEAFKALDDDNLLFAYTALTHFWNDPEVDVTVDAVEFHTVILKLLAKGGDASLPTNWRPICLIDTYMLLASSIITTRLDRYLVEEGVCQLMSVLYLSSKGSYPASGTKLQDPADPTDKQLRDYFKFAVEGMKDPVYGGVYQKAKKCYEKVGLRKLMDSVIMTGQFPK